MAAEFRAMAGDASSLAAEKTAVQPLRLFERVNIVVGTRNVLVHLQRLKKTARQLPAGL